MSRTLAAVVAAVLVTACAKSEAPTDRAAVAQASENTEAAQKYANVEEHVGGDSYQEGYEVGYEQGLEDGRQDGFDDGYDKGLDDGRDEGRSEALECVRNQMTAAAEAADFCE